MKRIILITVFVLAISAWLYLSGVGEQEQTTQSVVSPTLITPEKPVSTKISHSMVFIPYWNIPSDRSIDYDTLIYFGVAPDAEGSLQSDTGMANIDRFIENTSSSKNRYLTVRMLNTETNIEILENPKTQQKLIQAVADIAQEYGFDGIVLDLEMSVIPFSDTQEDISGFAEKLSVELRQAELGLMIAIYGDTFYRGRPYDVSFLGSTADEILIMAYDFHKSRGEPGPNFPFDRKGEYDFQQMVQDFSKSVEGDKLTVIFGMYGYDWTLGEQGLPLKAAQAIPLHEIESDILLGCSGDCKITTDKASMETKITYTDSDGYEHELWFEDEDSVELKTEYLEKQGIGSIGYWVWGYY